MNEEFAAYLTRIAASRDTIQQGLRLYLAERSDDRPIAEMHDIVRGALGEDLNDGLAALVNDSDLTEAAALAALSADWEDEARRPSIRAALEHAHEKLPVVEAGVIAIVTMYAMYLTATGGRRKSKRTLRDKEGRFVSEEIDYESPTPWLKALMSILRRK